MDWIVASDLGSGLLAVAGLVVIVLMVGIVVVVAVVACMISGRKAPTPLAMVEVEEYRPGDDMTDTGYTYAELTAGLAADKEAHGS